MMHSIKRERSSLGSRFVYQRHRLKRYRRNQRLLSLSSGVINSTNVSLNICKLDNVLSDDDEEISTSISSLDLPIDLDPPDVLFEDFLEYTFTEDFHDLFNEDEESISQYGKLDFCQTTKNVLIPDLQW